MSKAKKGEPVVSGIGILKIKLGACLTAPTKRMVTDLDDLAIQCNRVLHALQRRWIRYHEDNPNRTPNPLKRERDDFIKFNFQGKDKDGKLKNANIYGKDESSARKDFDKMDLEFVKVEPVLESVWMPKELEQILYYTVSEIAPELAAKVGSQLLRQLRSRLGAKMPYNHPGKAKFRWEAILNYEVNDDHFKGWTIPVVNQDTNITYAGNYATKNKVKQLDSLGGKSCSLVSIPLYSRESGREHKSHIARLHVRDMSPGMKDIVRKVSSGEWKLQDSKLVKIERGKKSNKGWYFYLTYEQPRKDLGLNKERIATLETTPGKNKDPFLVSFENRSWNIGDGLPLFRDYSRLDARRKVMRHRYQTGASKGHGKHRFYRNILPHSRAFKDMQDRFMFNAISDIVKFCVRNNCGTIFYAEPGKKLREHVWFANKNIPYNWTNFLSKLKYKCAIYGIDLQVQRTSTKEWKNKWEVSLEKQKLPLVKTGDAAIVYDTNDRKAKRVAGG